jgi:hypothetical protein
MVGRTRRARRTQGGSAPPEDDGEYNAEGANIRRKCASFYQRVEDNAFHLKRLSSVLRLENEHGVTDTDEVFHPRSIPICQPNAPVARGPTDCLRIVRAMNPNARLVQAYP